MSKVKIVYSLNDETKNYIGIKNKNRIIFKDEDIKFTLVLKDNSLDLIRENDEYRLEINIGENNNCNYFFKNYGKIQVEIEKIYLKIIDSSIELKYKLNDELFDLKMNLEVIE